MFWIAINKKSLFYVIHFKCDCKWEQVVNANIKIIENVLTVAIE